MPRYIEHRVSLPAQYQRDVVMTIPDDLTPDEARHLNGIILSLAVPENLRDNPRTRT